MTKRLLRLCCAVLFALSLHAQEAKTTLFVGGPKDHGAPNRHEYYQDTTVLKYCVDSASLPNVRARLFNGRAPAITTGAGGD